jgi:hypothetical protein
LLFITSIPLLISFLIGISAFVNTRFAIILKVKAMWEGKELKRYA